VLTRICLATVVLVFNATVILATDDTKKEGDLTGTWVVTSAERDGQAADQMKGDKATFEGANMTIQGTNEQKGTFKADSKKKPMTIDITHEGRPTVEGIYEIKGDELKFCFAMPGSGERPKDFASKQGTMVINLKKEKK
jgi:uncharacterized protein (TIGR03067 family)